MKPETKEKILLWKRYFDSGLSITSYLKYLYVATSFVFPTFKYVAIYGFVYSISCFFIGYFYYKAKWFEIDAEIGNKLNPFQNEVRHYIKKKPLNTRKHR